MQPQYQELTYEFQPDQVEQIHVRGDFLTCLDATGEFTVAFGSMSMTRFQKGLVFETEHEFQSFKLRNVSNAVIKITVGVGVGGIRDNRLVLSGAVETKEISATALSASPTITIAAGQVEEVLPANPARLSMLLRNLSTTARVWVKGDNSATGHGVPLEGLDAYSAAFTGAVFVFNQSGLSVQVSASELEI